MIKIFQKLKPKNWTKKPTPSFQEEMEQKNYKLSLALYEIFLEALNKFENSDALNEFIIRVEEIQKLESYFPKDASITKFRKEVRRDYHSQIQIVLEEIEQVLTNLYAKKYLEKTQEQREETQEQIQVNDSTLFLPKESQSNLD